jgi:glycine/D-amino acid oxidase-like deaminating enzyme
MRPGAGGISLWMDQVAAREPLPPLPGDRRFDVAVVGGGYTGLWVAYYLKNLAPHWSVAVLEAHVCGFGASGRNGGWLMGAIDSEVAMLSGLEEERRRQARDAIHSILPEVRRVLAVESIDCALRQGGGIFAAARYPEQETIQRRSLEQLHSVGYSEADYRWVGAAELTDRLAIRRPYGGVITPHVACIQPAALVRGLLVAVRRAGVEVYEQTRVLGLDSGGLRTDRGRVEAGIRVMALEGFAYEFADHRRRVLPVQSRIIATEPLADDRWAEIGLAGGEVFEDASPLITYGHRSVDGRMVFGSRGTYRFGARPQSDFGNDRAEFDRIRRVMLDCFPQLGGVPVTHAWGGTLGIARRRGPHAIYDPVSGLATAGGYSGEGVGGSNLMARTLVDLVLDRPSELADLPWAHRASPARVLRRWEPEPLRWLGYKAITLGQAWRESAYSRGGPAWQRRLATTYGRLVDWMPT